MQQDDRDRDLDQDFDFEDDQDDRSFVVGNVRISRDMAILLGALAFLILAVLLTFLFPVNDQEADRVAESLTQTAQSLASGTEVAVAGTDVASPGPGTTVAGVATPTATVFGTPNGTAYPGPGVVEEPAYPVPVGTPPGQGTSSPPTFAPTRSTPPAAGATPGNGYPGTGDDDDDVVIIDDDDDGGYPAPTNPPASTSPPAPTRAPQPQPQPTTAPAPTSAPQPQPQPQEPEPTSPPVAQDPGGGKEPGGDVLLPTTVGTEVAAPDQTPPVSPVTTTVALPPPPVNPVDVLSGSIQWTAAMSPIILSRDVQLAPGSTLIIDAGVEVRLGQGVTIFVDGANLFALGAPGQPVRFVNDNPVARWDGLFGRPGSIIEMKHTEVIGGGAGGTLMTSERDGQLIIKQSRIFDNGGAILVTDSYLEMADTEITGNDMPFGAALDAVYTRGGQAVIKNNRIGGNILSDGAPSVRLSNNSTIDTLGLDLQNNLFKDGNQGNLLLSTNGPLEGVVACNTLVQGNMGLKLRTQTLQVPGFPLAVFNNYIDSHTPPIIPIYLEFGIGRGATSEVALDMRNNWWGDASGPYDPELNPLGRGDSVGDNIAYEPWLTAPPECVPPE